MKKKWVPSQLDKLRAIERALSRSGDETATVEAALSDTRRQIADERAARLEARKAAPEPDVPVAKGNRQRLTALVVARTKLTTASQLVKESTVAIALSGLLPVEVREDARKIADVLDGFVERRITSTIEHIP